MKPALLLRGIVMLLAAVIVFSTVGFAPPTPVRTAYALSDGDFTYSVADGKATLTAYTGAGGDVEIPSELGGYPVTEIGDKAFYNNRTITDVTIPEGILNIGDAAFCLCLKLKHVTIPDGLIIISDDAFALCNQMEGLSIPNSVTSIGTSSFYGCSNITSIKVPGSVENIGASTFEGCSAISIVLESGLVSIGTRAFAHNQITDINIPSTVSSICLDAFSNCYELTTINVDPQNTVYSSEHGVFFNKAKTILLLYPFSKSGTIYTIPSSVSEIEDFSFLLCKLESVIIPNGVKKIGEYAFSETRLKSVSIPSSVESIGYCAFMGCNGLTHVNVEDTNPYYSSQDGVLFNKTATMLIAYPKGKKQPEYSIPDNVTEIGNGAFLHCYDLKRVNIPNSVTSIGNEAFKYCTMSEIDLPDSLAHIGIGAFSDNTSLYNINIPNSVTSLEPNTFCGCSNLRGIYLHESLTSIGSSTFASTGLENIKIPETVTSIGTQAFALCNNLTKAYFYGDAPQMQSSVFSKCGSGFTVYYPNNRFGYTNPWFGISTIACVPEDMPPYTDHGFAGSSGDYDFWAENGEVTITKYKGSGGAIIVSSELNGNAVRTIGNDAFRGNTSITSITLKEGVTNIDRGAFAECDNLTSVDIPDSVISIGQAAFLSCSSLTSISIPPNVTTIESNTFIHCYNLNKVIFNEGLTILGSTAFAFCNSLDNVIIPGSVTKMENSIFLLTNLNDVYFKGNAPEMADFVFEGCAPGFTVYYPVGASGYSDPWYGYHTESYDPEAQLLAPALSIDRTANLIKGVSLNVSADQLKSFFLNSSENLTILDKDGNEYTGSSVGTGMRVQLSVGGEVKDTLTISAVGDVSGDGKISVADYTLVRLHLLGLKSQSGACLAASDVNQDGSVSVSDYADIRLDILGIRKIH